MSVEDDRVNKSADEIARLDAAEQGTPTEKPKAKAKPEEKRGAGRDDSQANFERLAKGLRAKISVAKGAGNTALAAKLEARLAELRKTVQ